MASPSHSSSVIGFLVAPDATRREWIVSLAAAGAGAVLAPLHAAARVPALGAPRLALLAVIAFDCFGGAAANCTDSGKRFWHRPGRTAASAFWFVAGHVTHLAIVAFAFRAGDLRFLAAAGAALIAASALVLRAPGPIKRVVAAALFAGAVLLDAALGPAPGLEWFTPVFFFKLLVGHLVPEGEARAASPA